MDSEIGAELAQLRRNLAEISRSVADLAANPTPSAGRADARSRRREWLEDCGKRTRVGGARIRDYVDPKI